jgi:hypothetical protein
VRSVLILLALAGAAGCRSSSGGSPAPMDYPSPCPSSEPAAHAACTSDGLACEYGNDTNLACNALHVCGSGAWASSPAADAGLVCDPSVEAACQPTYDAQKSLTSMGSCAPPGLLCAFAQGTCGCVPPSGTPNVDGGPVTQTAKWNCVDLPAGCPFPRRHVGDGCVTPNEDCDYAACQGGVTLGCTSDHVWAELPSTCPQ